jgi:hypothetical protein
MSGHEYTESIDENRPLLVCVVCMSAFHGEDDVTCVCYRCGRAGFCEHCCDPSRHDCVRSAKEHERTHHAADHS